MGGVSRPAVMRDNFTNEEAPIEDPYDPQAVIRAGKKSNLKSHVSPQKATVVADEGQE